MSYGVDFDWLMGRGRPWWQRYYAVRNPLICQLNYPERFEFVVNLRTAKAIDITLPTATLLRADEVIE
jgi:hypothetical protein